jgi:hypothetical protein
MKRCSWCKKEKKLEAFNKHRKSKDGRQSQCRDCNRAFRIRWHRQDPERTRVYDRRRAKTLKVIVRRQMKSALERGELKRPDHCTSCGLVCKPEGHHPDYSKPLHVMWLCRECHDTEHIQIRERLTRSKIAS